MKTIIIKYNGELHREYRRDDAGIQGIIDLHQKAGDKVAVELWTEHLAVINVIPNLEF